MSTDNPRFKRNFNNFNVVRDEEQSLLSQHCRPQAALKRRFNYFVNTWMNDELTITLKCLLQLRTLGKKIVIVLKFLVVL